MAPSGDHYRGWQLWCQCMGFSGSGSRYLCRHAGRCVYMYTCIHQHVHMNASTGRAQGCLHPHVHSHPCVHSPYHTCDNTLLKSQEILEAQLTTKIKKCSKWRTCTFTISKMASCSSDEPKINAFNFDMCRTYPIRALYFDRNSCLLITTTHSSLY